MDVEKAVNEILEDLEYQPLQDRRTFRSLINNPELISVSSTNAQEQSPPISANTFNSYYNFTINLPRPAIGAKSLQLLKAIVPQAQCSIPDYSLVFPYYRLRCVPVSAGKGDVRFVDDISYNNLNFIRLLPSTYKKEILKAVAGVNVNQWGLNSTFSDYESLLVELKKACANDISFGLNSHYIANDISFSYSEEQNKFIFEPQNINTPPELNTVLEWDGIATYNPNDYVVYEQQFYKARITNTNVEPGTNDVWQLQTNTNWYPTYYPYYLYSKYDVVQYDGIFYMCQVDSSIAEEPLDNPNWLNISQFFATNNIFNIYLIAGYQLSDVQTLLQYIQQNSQRINGDTPLTSVPGNQYVEYQTLARRTGFTWDGSGLITNRNTINSLLGDTGIRYGSTIALFFNRLRPVDNYPLAGDIIETEQLNLGVFYDYDRNNYTADGYCNLVYSSIINIYTTIIGTSSVDTQRNANLLATLEMNAGNLGIMMANNFIDTKLTKIQTDLYSLYFELRDEVGQPYLLTNNATTTLLLKLTYSE